MKKDEAASRNSPSKAFISVVPVDLVFDSSSCDNTHIDRPTTPQKPANAVELWRQNWDHSDAVARAVISMISENPNYASDLGDQKELELLLQSTSENEKLDVSQRSSCLVGLGILYQSRKAFNEALSFLQKAFDLQKTAMGITHPITIRTVKYLVEVLDELQRPEDAKRLRLDLSIGELMQNAGNLTALRSKALELFVNNEYKEAEKIYHHLLEQNFEPASTHCHLARIYFMTGRTKEAAAEVKSAMECKHGAPAYMIPRIIFLRIICAVLEGIAIKALLKELNNALLEPGANHDWTMQPVVDCLKSGMSSEYYELFSALVKALGDAQHMNYLNEMPIWQEALAF
jgi:tetratricopeptide (TPR) repeat protein